MLIVPRSIPGLDSAVTAASVAMAAERYLGIVARQLRLAVKTH
jgi:hypothetical protein